MEPAPARPQGTREALVLTAERLIAEEGIGAVSLRRIAAAAGQRNVASVQYHFGSRTGLLRAVLQHRLPEVNRRRLDLLDQLRTDGREDDVRSLVDAMVRPLFELDPDSRYVEFAVQIRTSPELGEVLDSVEVEQISIELLAGQLHRALRWLPTQIRTNRIRMASAFMLDAIAEWRTRRATPAGGGLSDEAFLDDLVDAITGMLSFSNGSR